MTPAATRTLQVSLAALAGYVDALGFLSLGGFYVAFMSGNSTLLGIGLATADDAPIATAAGLVVAFVAGVVLGTLVGRRARRRPVHVLLAVAIVLAGAWALHKAGHATLAAAALALAMGAENTTLARDGQPGVGLTYMTGTLVRLGQRAADALAGAPWRALLPDALLWSGMLAGAILGASTFKRFGLDGILAAIAATLAMAAAADRTNRHASPAFTPPNRPGDRT